MPLYEYQCSRCGHKFEVYHQIGGAAGPCPVCGGPARRVFSSIGLIFKGSGFHTTDYRKSTPAGETDGKPAASPPSAESPSTAPKTPSKTPAKAPSKTSPKPSS